MKVSRCTLMSADAARQEFLATSVPPSARGLMAGAFAGTVSPRQAIKAACLACCCYDRAEVAGCTVILCPLHRYRPYQETCRKGSRTASGSAICDGTTSAGIPILAATPGRENCARERVSGGTAIRELGRTG
jgi:hypothetical protein